MVILCCCNNDLEDLENKTMTTAKQLVINALLAGLFLVCIISFGGILGNNYGKPNLMDTGYIDTDRVTTAINQTSQDAENWGEAFTSDNIFVSTGAIIIFSIWGVFKLIYTSVITMFVIYFDIVGTLFGLPAIVTGVLTAIIIITLIFAGWKLIKTGE